MNATEIMFRFFASYWPAYIFMAIVGPPIIKWAREGES